MMYFLIVALVVGAVTATASYSPAANSSSWYYNYWCGHELQYLDDAKCAKIFPSVVDRDWTCPIPALTKPPADYQRGGLYGDIKVDTSSLSTYINDNAINLCMVLTKRVADASQPQNVALYHKYFCLGERSASEPFETWSSSKIFAVANGAGHLRTNETSCAQGVYGVGGGFVNGKHGPDTQLGDLATVICSYDSTAGYSSNSLSSYFHDLGWRDRINSVVLNEWLQVPSDQTLGGNYGEATPSDLGFTVSAPGTATSCAADKDPWPVKYSNSISALTAVELTRRLVHHRDMEESLRFPGVEWADVRDLLYGAESSGLFPGQRWGGMTADTAIYLQSSSTMQSLLVENPATLADGRWRIFSKLGAGYSSSRYVGEIVSNAHACVPTVENGVVAGGLEVTITVRGSIAKDASLSTVDLRVQAAMDAALQFAAKYN